jgi:PDZ domain
MSPESRATPLGGAPFSRDLWGRSGAVGLFGCELSRAKRVLRVATTMAMLTLVVSCTRGHTSAVNASLPATSTSSDATAPAVTASSSSPLQSPPVPKSPSPAPSPVAAAVAEFVPATYRVTSTTSVDLDDSGTPQVAVTAVGSVQDGGSSGFAPSTVLLLAWDSVASRWTEAFDASREQSYQASSQQGAGPGLVDLTGAGPQVAVVHDQPKGAADLLYWVNSVGGNSGNLIVGIVHFARDIASLTYSENGDEGHVDSFDVPITASAGVTVTGSTPHQVVQITLPWITTADDRSQAARMYTRTLAPTSDYDSYQVVADNRPYVGVAITPLTGGTEARVNSVDPNSPASGLLRVGDILTGAADTPLAANITRGLLGPPVIDEVAVLQPGTTVTLQFIRNGQPSHVTLRLARWGTAANAMADIGPAAL